MVALVYGTLNEALKKICTIIGHVKTENDLQPLFVDSIVLYSRV